MRISDWSSDVCSSDLISPAGAYGLMQIMPAAAIDIGRAHGRVIDRADLTRPSTNIEVGQSYLEQLRDQACTGGLLPKVIAAYNAGQVPVSAWDASTPSKKEIGSDTDRTPVTNAHNVFPLP